MIPKVTSLLVTPAYDIFVIFGGSSFLEKSVFYASDSAVFGLSASRFQSDKELAILCNFFDEFPLYEILNSRECWLSSTRWTTNCRGLVLEELLAVGCLDDQLSGNEDNAKLVRLLLIINFNI